MKSIRIILLLLNLLLAVNTGNAQWLRAFTAASVNGHVVLEFTIAAGNTCNGIDILHATDPANYLPIGSIAGVCGSSTTDEKYSFVDPDPAQGTVNYYRLDLKNLGYSEPVTILVYHAKPDEILVFPNPVASELNIYYERISNVSDEVYLYNSSGQLLFQSPIFPEKVTTLKMETFSSGNYVLRILSGTGIFLEERIQLITPD